MRNIKTLNTYMNLSLMHPLFSSTSSTKKAVDNNIVKTASIVVT